MERRPDSTTMFMSWKGDPMAHQAGETPRENRQSWGRRIKEKLGHEPQKIEAPSDSGPEFTADFAEVFAAERAAIEERRRFAYKKREKLVGEPEPEEAARDDLIGLSLSGGGIRSATFNLGLIQAFQRIGLFRHVDYLVTTSGGGYIGAHLAQKAAQADTRAEAVEARSSPTESNGQTSPDPNPAEPPPSPDNWFPYPIGAGGRQVDGVLDFYKHGDYLNRPIQFGWTWLPGAILNAIMLLSLMVSSCALLAFGFRCLDFPWVDQALRFLGRNFFLGAYRFKNWLGSDAEGILSPFPAAAWLVLLGAGVPLLLLGFGDVLGRGRFDRPAGPDVPPRRFYLDSVLRRLGRLLFWPMTILSIACASIFWMDWPTREEIGRGVETAGLALGPWEVRVPAGTDEDDRRIEARRWQEMRADLARRIEQSVRRAEVWSSETVVPAQFKEAREQASYRAELLLNLLSGDPRRIREAIPRVDAIHGLASPRGSIPPSLDRMTTRELVSEAAERVVPTIALLDEAVGELPVGAWDSFAEPREFAGGPDALRSTLTESLATARAIGLNNLVVTDLLRALLPAIIWTLLYVVVATWQYVTRGVRQFNGRQPNDVRAKIARWCWILLGLGLILCLTNGDTDIGGLKYIITNISGFNEVIDPVTGVVSGARMTLSGTLAAARSWAFAVLVAVAATLAMVPIASRGRFIRSAEMPKDSLQGRMFRLIIGAVIFALPLAWFAFFARENISGAAPLKAAEIAATASVGEPYVARMAYCPDSLYQDRAYLIHNDQVVRFILFATGAVVFLLLALAVDLNHNSIHTFYRDRLYEAYLADKPREERRKIKLADLDGTRVGFPLHLISATLNQFHGPDDLQESLHQFSFSRLYCGSLSTGYRRTDRYREGVDLADAVAISGAAISPIQARALAARLAMLVLNMRLGQWYSNPNPAYEPHRRSIRPFLAVLLWDNVWPFRRRRPAGDTGPDELRRFCFLSDGAHLDNLGIGVMLRRRCRLMIVSDVSNDPDYGCEQLAAVFRHYSAHKGITFTPIPMAAVRKRLGLPKVEIHADPDTRLDPFHFRSERDPEALARLKARMSRENFLVGRVDYTEEPARSGILVLVKPSLTAELVDHATLFQHFLSHQDFPHDPDLDQIYDETRVEAYRQLGECVGDAFGRILGPPGKSPEDSRRDLLAAVERLLDAADAPSPAPPKPAKAPGHVPV